MTEDTYSPLGYKIFSASAGAMLTTLLVTPFDVVKVRTQVASTHGAVSFDSNALRTMRTLSRNEGWTSLYKGLVPSLAQSIPATVVYFIGYDALQSRTPFPATLSPLLCGAFARIIAVTAISPLEFIRTRKQSLSRNLPIYQDMISCLRVHGLGYFWKGLLPTLLRDVPFSGIYWLSYEHLKPYFSSFSTFSSSFACGCLSGALAAFLTTPFDVVKTFQQTHDLHHKTPVPPFGRTVHVIYTESGVSGFFSGLSARLLKVTPACGIMIASYSFGKEYFGLQA